MREDWTDRDEAGGMQIGPMSGSSNGNLFVLANEPEWGVGAGQPSGGGMVDVARWNRLDCGRGRLASLKRCQVFTSDKSDEKQGIQSSINQESMGVEFGRTRSERCRWGHVDV